MWPFKKKNWVLEEISVCEVYSKRWTCSVRMSCTLTGKQKLINSHPDRSILRNDFFGSKQEALSWGKAHAPHTDQLKDIPSHGDI